MIQLFLAMIAKSSREKKVKKAKTAIYYDRHGAPLSLPTELVPYAQEADEIDVASMVDEDLGATARFGPYTAAQMRSVIYIAMQHDDIDMALLSLVAHTTWRDPETGDAE